jgi:hypothetical protein
LSDIQIQIEGSSYDLDEFEIGELEWLEDHVGGSLASGDTLFSMKAMVGFVYLIRKRENPEYTLDDARKVKLSAVGPDDEEPEGEAAEPKKRPTKPRV